MNTVYTVMRCGNIAPGETLWQTSWEFVGVCSPLEKAMNLADLIHDDYRVTDIVWTKRTSARDVWCGERRIKVFTSVENVGYCIIADEIDDAVHNEQTKKVKPS